MDGQAAGGRGPSVVRVTDPAGLVDALDAAGVPRGRPALVLVGGAGGMDDAALQAVQALLGRAVVPVLDRHAAAVVDGGTDAGVMRAIGRARSAGGHGFPLIGVAAEGTVALPGREQPRAHAVGLEDHHTHVVLVPGSEWGDESGWLAVVADAVADGHPSVTVLVNGGEIAYADVWSSVERGRPLLVLAGTGRTADAIAAVPGPADDPRAARIAGSALTRVVPVDDVGAVRSALDAALAGPS
jgi:hypothetical protein